MSPHKTRLLNALAAAGIVATGLVFTPVIQAFNFGDMMSPGKWMGGGRDRDYDDEWSDYGPGPYGPPPGAGIYGAPYGGPYGVAPGYGPYGGPGYGGPGYGRAGYGTPGYYGAPGPQAAPRAPATSSTSTSSSSQNVKSAEIEALKKRIEELETKQQPSYTAPPPPPADWGTSSSSTPSNSSWGSAPAFRPMDKY